MSVWYCKIGELPGSDDFDLPLGSDGPLRTAVQKAYLELTGKEAAETFSGWGGEWSPEELDAINGDTLMDPDDGDLAEPKHDVNEKETPSRQIIRYFEYGHLPEKLQRVSSQFRALAWWLENSLPNGPEKTVALRKLLEAKDAAVRSALDL